MGKLDYLSSTNRVFCADPNDSHGVVNGMPLTPDYTDYCIWCNLIVEKVSRFKNQVNGTDITESYYISYDLSSSSHNEYVSFMSGADQKHGYNFLTTDYSDIDFNTVKKRNTIEGLQIESIKISLQNFNCPSVVIKFTDIRGSGFFGREEATHNEYGKLSGLEVDENGEPIENIFGSFATIPYPRFKLQIKGFYGTPVTYQLTCSGFDGSFNSSTGNFDITVRFVGYEYGVLGDIPFSYIVAAPLTEIGNVYWKKHVDSPAWRLPSGNNTSDSQGSDQPIPLVDFFNRVESSLDRHDSEDTDINDVVLDSMYADFITSYAERTNLLKEIQKSLLEFKQHIVNEFNNENIVSVQNTDTDVIVIFSKSENLTCKQELLDLRNSYADKVYDYLTKYSDDVNKFDTTIIPGSDKNWEEEKWTSTNVKCSEYINFQNSDGTTQPDPETAPIHPNSVVEAASKNGDRVQITSQTSCCGSKIIRFDESKKLTVNKSLSSELYTAFGIKAPGAKQWAFDGSTSYKKYAVAVDFQNASQKISDTLTFLELKYKEYQDIAKEKNNTTISKLVGFAPYVSNYFKTVMCHVETLAYLFKNTADTIYGQMQRNEREPRKLGVASMQLETDIPGQKFKQIPPFPATYKTKESEYETDTRIRTGENIVQTTWVGDFKGTTEWAEEKLVDDIVKGLKEVWDTAKSSSANKRKKKNEALFPTRVYIPIDFIAPNPSNYISKLSASSNVNGPELLAYYAATRAELLFGVFDQSPCQDETLYELIGAMDGYRIMSSNCDINQFFEGLEEDQTMADEIYNLTLCKNNGDSETLEFELVNTGSLRHPIFTDNSEKEYKYITTTNGAPIIPTDNFDKFNDLSRLYVYNNSKWYVSELNSDSYVFGENATTFITGQSISINSNVSEGVGNIISGTGSLIGTVQIIPTTVPVGVSVTIGTVETVIGTVTASGMIIPIGADGIENMIGRTVETQQTSIQLGTDNMIGTTTVTIGTTPTVGVIVQIDDMNAVQEEADSILSGYTNESMFHVITDQGDCAEIMEKILPFSGNTTYLGGYNAQLLRKIRNRYILSSSNCEQYKLQNYLNMKNGYTELGILPSELVSQNGDIPEDLMSASASQTGLFIQAFTSCVDSQCAANN